MGGKKNSKVLIITFMLRYESSKFIVESVLKITWQNYFSILIIYF